MAPASFVVAAAALEITVHGWDVAQALGQTSGRSAPIPEALAAALLPVADALVSPQDRGSLFEPVLEVADESSAEEHLLAYLGRAPVYSTCVVRGQTRYGASAGFVA